MWITVPWAAYADRMRALSIALGESRPLLLAQLAQFVAAVEALDDLALLDPARCRGWSRLEVIVHVRLGLAEMAVAVAAFTICASLRRAPATSSPRLPDARSCSRTRRCRWVASSRPG